MADILLLSPYDCLSHRYWRTSLASWLRDHAGARVTTAALPPRFFSWRQRGNSLTFARHDSLQRTYDLVIATSMTDISALRGLNRAMRNARIIAYYHENQFAFPDRSVEGLIERQLTSIYSALSADAVVFNSAFNRDSFVTGAQTLLSRMPDGVPDGVLEALPARIIPVALEDRPVVASASHRGPLRILWNHRWEHDKDPGQLLAIVTGLLAAGVSFEMSLLGERFRETPEEMAAVVTLLNEHGCLRVNGFIEARETYLQTVASHDIVLSTALQEFQGLSVQEAILLGCLPVVPDALVYPEYVPADYRYTDTRQAVDLLAGKLPPFPADGLDPYRWPAVGAAWLALIDGLMS